MRERHPNGDAWYDKHSRIDFGARMQALREEMRERRRASRQRCICEPGDPCDYHAALGIGSVVDFPAAARETSE